MSRPSIVAKLTLVMRAPAQAVELIVSFAPDSDPPAGTVRDRTGREPQFNGWLGLLRLLEDALPTRGMQLAPTTRQENA